MDVHAIATRHNGIRSWNFSQSGSVSLPTWLAYKDFSMKGICAGLSAHWIKEHAYGGTLANLLGGGGTGQGGAGKVNFTKLKAIALLQALSERGGSGDQEKRILAWLRLYDLIPSEGSNKNGFQMQARRTAANPDGYAAPRGQAQSSRAMTNGSGINVPFLLVNKLKELGRKEYYAYITFGGTCFGTSAAHVVALFVGRPNGKTAGDAVFFDPNYGEYWFEHRNDFYRFFPEFYAEAYMTAFTSFDRSFTMQPLALSMKAEFARRG